LRRKLTDRATVLKDSRLDAQRGAAQPSRVASLECQTCGAPVPYDEPIPRDAECGKCRTDLRCCRNCRHYDPHLNNECRETQADPVVEKNRRNFCEYFYFSRETFLASKTGGKAAEARAKLDSMFGGKPTPAQADARAKLDAMFGGPSKSSREEREAEAKKKLNDLFGGGDRERQ
jgi:hypothetical protein